MPSKFLGFSRMNVADIFDADEFYHGKLSIFDETERTIGSITLKMSLDCKYKF